MLFLLFLLLLLPAPVYLVISLIAVLAGLGNKYESSPFLEHLRERYLLCVNPPQGETSIPPRTDPEFTNQ